VSDSGPTRRRRDAEHVDTGGASLRLHHGRRPVSARHVHPAAGRILPRRLPGPGVRRLRQWRETDVSAAKRLSYNQRTILPLFCRYKTELCVYSLHPCPPVDMSYDDCLENKREDTPVRTVLCCIVYDGSAQ